MRRIFPISCCRGLDDESRIPRLNDEGGTSAVALLGEFNVNGDS